MNVIQTADAFLWTFISLLYFTALFFEEIAQMILLFWALADVFLRKQELTNERR